MTTEELNMIEYLLEVKVNNLFRGNNTIPNINILRLFFIAQFRKHKIRNILKKV